MEYLIALLALAAMEIVLGIDNIVFIAILTGKLPPKQQPSARRLGLALAMILRILLLLTVSWILGLTQTIFDLASLGLPETWIGEEEIRQVTARDLIFVGGGLFLIWKSVSEIHDKVVGVEHEQIVKGQVTYGRVLFQIALMDIIFSLDSVITAVGMVDMEGEKYWYGIAVIVTAIVLAVLVMLVFAEAVSHFVERNPTLKMLALAFLLLIGVMLVAEGIGTHVNKGYIYFAMAFALGVEVLNLRVRHSTRKSPPGAQTAETPS